MIRGVPELYDGGYWYVVPVVGTGASDDEIRPDIDAAGWCAWYDGDTAIVRTPDPIDAGSLGVAGMKPHGRVGGR